ncbi:MAG: Hsp20/alpha crystallin family protein [Planctomycetota bacterium]|jgi:HSP20 family protein
MLNIIRHHDPIGRSVRDLLSFAVDESLFRTPAFGSDAAGTLALDIAESEGELIVRASVPGFGKDDIEVQILDGVLSIKAERTEDSETTDERFYRRERRVGSVSRTVALPGELTVADSRAELADGVLTLRIPQAEASRPKQIPIE